MREMRGVWVASVANIDWPSAPGLDDVSLRLEVVRILDRAKSIGLNSVFLQVRPSSDTFYFSDLEPLSSYLVGNQVDARPGFDPLKYWIEQAHARGLELHAWINPFRVSTKADFVSGNSHISKVHPEWIVNFGDKLCLDPGIPEARYFVRDVVMDVVNRYDVDGIHFDDYFYPYPSAGLVFDDSKSFKDYNPRCLRLADWRRANVTSVIAMCSESIRGAKPWVQFGISPFGVWRNKKNDPSGSNTTAGVTDYDDLFADIIDWINKSYIDYVIPQLYWISGYKAADFDELCSWWSRHATNDTKIFVGHSIYKIGTGKSPGVGWNSRSEMPNQVKSVRANRNLDGSVFFRIKFFDSNLLGFEDFLKSDFYSAPALQIPVTKGSAGEISVSGLERDGNRLNWTVEGDTANVRFFMVFRSLRSEAESLGSNESIVSISDKPYFDLPSSSGRKQRFVYRVAAVDRYRVLHPMSRRLTIKE